MKRKITYILKNIDNLLINILKNTNDFKSQVKLAKEKEEIIKQIENIIKKYEKIINEK